eukprot:TRINITY_DN15114_c0_g1_i2.p2 TRINITY_DN15114_c0_g1~~TRINITY_DN15114_c0_g1_i2.p2  ORF type:complete len:160 (-),score=20.16 TRINITY_DN15114_c0_g1_i2:45-524(-)
MDTKTNERTGIDIDIINQLANQLGVNRVQLEVVPFSELLENLSTDDSIDVIASGFTITEKRKNLVNFTNPLYKESEAIVVPEISLINFKEDLRNSVVGVQKGTVFVDFAENWKREGKIKEVITFESIYELFSAISARKIDAAITDSIIADYIISPCTLR